MIVARRVAIAWHPCVTLSGGLLALAVAMAAPLSAAPQDDLFGPPEEGAVEISDADLFGEAPGAADPFGDGDDPFGADPQTEPVPVEQRAAPPTTDQRAATPMRDRGGGSQPVIWAGPAAEEDAKVRAALERPLPSMGLQFTQTPLAEVAQFLGDEYKIEVQIDAPALNDFGINADEQVSANIQNVSLRSALRLMLDRLELEYIVANGVLLITTEEEAETRLKVAVYPVGDLVASDGHPGDFDALIDTLISTVASETWAENGGGEAEMRALPPGRLVISQTERVHEQVAAALAALRKAASQPQTTAAAPAAGVYTRAYALAMPPDADPDAFLSRLMALVRKMAPAAAREGVDPDGRAYVLDALADRVVVRNDRAAHREVETLLSDLGLLRPPPSRGLGGGGFGGGGFGGGGGAF